ncbi:SIMPL domain-containing protein [Ureibacillus composti]|nr:SIMPL domain-containing protein [Ureibacillus composti]
MFHSSISHPITPSYRVITVTGNSELTVRPTIAEVQIEVSTQNMDIATAQRENASLTNQVIQSLLVLGIDRDDIQTAFFNVMPRYDYVDGRQVFRGYEVRNAINVTVRNLSDVGVIIDTAIQNGANRISSLKFKVEDESPYYERALSLAIQDANSKASAIARSLGLNYMPQPIEVTEQSVGGPILFKTVAFTEQAIETPIEPGTITINATVQVKYQY